MRVVSFVLFLASWSMLDAYGGLIQRKYITKRSSKKIASTEQFDVNSRNIVKDIPKEAPVAEAPNVNGEEDQPPPNLAEAIHYLTRQAKRIHKNQPAKTTADTGSFQKNIAEPERYQSNDFVDNAIQTKQSLSQTVPIQPVYQQPVPNNVGVDIQTAIHQKENVASQPAMQGQQALHQMLLNQGQPALQTVHNNQFLTNQGSYVNRPIQMAAQSIPQGVDSMIPMQALPQSVSRHVLFPRVMPQQTPPQQYASGPRYVVIRSPETGALQLKEIGTFPRNSVAVRQTVPPQRPFTYPTVFQDSMSTTVVPYVHKQRPPRPPVYLTQAPTTTTTATTTTTTTTPAPVTTIPTTSAPAPTQPPVTQRITTPTTELPIPEAAPVDTHPASEHNAWEPSSEKQQAFFDKEMKKQNLEITKLQLEIQLLRQQTQAASNGQMPELEEMPPMLQRLHKKRMASAQYPFPFMGRK
ncbi:hypothetical protein MAR_004532 [Mya arenaria]|uniref:Uncharacterized protein n=1 Tax=Mya arenaria TaxID=6604 RepID=A0ABY7EZZ6_MYAAR|nr:rho GTPase-activating protein gacK-like [Mya arenaria]XP_052761028.1 rho GTPase-activating protein gacK-like [Mya arenaria]WAR14427.1 hypothetical protein MAR_004532 [Mya arenaria]